MSDQFFEYSHDKRFIPLLFPLGVGRDDGVTVGDTTMRATFGHVSIETPLANVTGTSVSGPHQWFKAVGLRLSFSDDGLTFGTDHRRGLCIEFDEKVPKVIGFRNHSSLWVSVADPDGLADALA